VKKKQDTFRKGKNAPESESDSEEKPSVFTKTDFEQALRKVSRRIPKPEKEKS
jgi:hypothetical protein